MIYSKLRYFKNSFFKFIKCQCLFPPFPICLKVFSQHISFQQGSNVPLSPKEYTHLHCTPKTIIIQCMHYYFDEMAKLQTYQHYFIHPPSTNIDLITKYVKCPILKYYFNYITHKTNVLQIWRTAITPQSDFFYIRFWSVVIRQ